MVRTPVASIGTTTLRISAVAAALLVAGVLDFAPAWAGPCTAQIAQVESAHRTAGAGVPLSAPQSVGAQLHRQPTPSSVQQAEAQSDAAYKSLLEAAKKLDADGKREECMAKVEELKRMLVP
jgi:hypothetical protein